MLTRGVRLGAPDSGLRSPSLQGVYHSDGTGGSARAGRKWRPAGSGPAGRGPHVGEGGSGSRSGGDGRTAPGGDCGVVLLGDCCWQRRGPGPRSSRSGLRCTCRTHRRAGRCSNGRNGAVRPTGGRPLLEWYGFASRQPPSPRPKRQRVLAGGGRYHRRRRHGLVARRRRGTCELLLRAFRGRARALLLERARSTPLSPRRLLRFSPLPLVHGLRACGLLLCGLARCLLWLGGRWGRGLSQERDQVQGRGLGAPRGLRCTGRHLRRLSPTLLRPRVLHLGLLGRWRRRRRLRRRRRRRRLLYGWGGAHRPPLNDGRRFVRRCLSMIRRGHVGGCGLGRHGR